MRGRTVQEESIQTMMDRDKSANVRSDHVRKDPAIPCGSAAASRCYVSSVQNASDVVMEKTAKEVFLCLKIKQMFLHRSATSVS